MFNTLKLIDRRLEPKTLTFRPGPFFFIIGEFLAH